jgi:hypothetical protein
MGIVFIAGGFCPGVSFSAIAIGKIDAMVFLGGIFIGIFMFAEAYPLLESFYMSGNLGALKLSDALGISGGLLAFLVIIAALAMFWIGDLAEKKFPREEY